MSARDRILNAIRRQADGAPGRSSDAATARLNGARDAFDPGPIPEIGQLDGAARVDRFIAEAEKVQATVSRLADMSDLPAALATELRNRNLGPSIRLGDEPDFQGLDWGGIETSRGPGRFEEPASLSRAYSAMAETGTLMLLSGANNPVTLTFLGETHFAVIRASEIEAGFEGAWARLRAEGRDSRTVNMVTGPSRTADIEQQLELGAHGPVALHVFVIDDA